MTPINGTLPHPEISAQLTSKKLLAVYGSQRPTTGQYTTLEHSVLNAMCSSKPFKQVLALCGRRGQIFKRQRWAWNEFKETVFSRHSKTSGKGEKNQFFLVEPHWEYQPYQPYFRVGSQDQEELTNKMDFFCGLFLCLIFFGLFFLNFFKSYSSVACWFHFHFVVLLFIYLFAYYCLVMLSVWKRERKRT